MRRYFLIHCGGFLLLSFLVGLLAGRAHAASIPSGTKVQVRLNTKLDTGVTKVGQTFSATIADPVIVGGRTVLSRGARVSGRVTAVVSSGRLKKPAAITLVLTSIPSQPLQIDGKSHVVRNTELIGGGAGLGALIGALTGGKEGAAVGAGVGAGAGATTAYITGKKEIVLPAETLLTFVTGSSSGASVASRPAPSQPVYSPAGSRENAGGSPGPPEGFAGSAPYFASRDQQLIRSYYAENAANLPPGLAKRGGNLPPGLERQLQRNGTLPPGLQKRVEPFPPALERQLTPLPSGYSRVYLAGRALILDSSNKILDLMVVIR